MKRNNRGYARIERVGQQIHEVLAVLVLTEVSDPRVRDIQITGVDVAPDLRTAKVYFVMLASDDAAAIEGAAEGLERASGYLRKMLSERVSLKYLPALTFVYDQSIEEGRKIENLLAEVAEVDEVRREEE